MSMNWPDKLAIETLDYSVDWSRWLSNGHVLTSVRWYIDDESGNKVLFENGATVNGLIKNNQTNTQKVSTIYLSGGTPNKTYKIYCHVTDSLWNVTERTVYLKIKGL
jgi:hypothetical protein